jgi:hypothetical protein
MDVAPNMRAVEVPVRPRSGKIVDVLSSFKLQNLGTARYFQLSESHLVITYHLPSCGKSQVYRNR